MRLDILRSRNTVFLVTFLAPAICAAQLPTGIQYISPLPDSRLVSQETNIIIRSASAVDPAILFATSFLSVTGASSGLHGGRLVLSDDGHTVVFEPFSAFAARERVTVRIDVGAITGSGADKDQFEYGFDVTSLSGYEQKILLSSVAGLDYRGIVPSTAGAQAGRKLEKALSDSLPPDFPSPISIISNLPSPGSLFFATWKATMTPGNVQYDSSDQQYLTILDGSAKPIFYRPMSGLSTDFKIQPNGNLTYFDQTAGAYYELDTTYAVVDSFRCGNGYPTDLHELQLLPNGHALLIGQEIQYVDMSQLVQGGRPGALVIGNVIQELDQNKNVVFQWRSFDHFQITDATHENLKALAIDCVHTNTIEVDTDGNILISSRHLDEITKIDRQTGNIIWRWGGRNNQFRFINDSIGFSHQHTIRRLASGNLLMFDNGNYHTPSFSRAVEYAMDEQAKTVTLVWQFRHNPDVYGLAMGSTQRLPNGNTLIGWGTTNPALTEVRPGGEIAYELYLPPGIVNYRAFRGTWNFPFARPAVVSGLVRYGSDTGPPVAGVSVTLSAPRSTAAHTTSSDQNGQFAFAGLSQGNYVLRVSKSGSYPGTNVNARDAVKVLQFCRSNLAYPLSPLQLLAADVDGDGLITTSDATQILLRYVGIVNSYPTGDWVFLPSTSALTIGAQDVHSDISCLAVGDVNGDAQLTGGSSQGGSVGTGTVVLENRSAVRDSSTDEIEIPVRVNVPCDIGSISMKLQYPAALATFVSAQGPRGMVSAASNGVIGIAWLNTDTVLSVKEGDVIVTLHFKASGNSGALSLALDPASQFGDVEGELLQGIRLEALSFGSELPLTYSLSQNYPNPFNPATNIQFSLPNQANVTLKVYDLIGREITTLLKSQEQAGTHTVKFDGSRLPSGVYFYRLSSSGGELTKMMMLIK